MANTATVLPRAAVGGRRETRGEGTGEGGATEVKRKLFPETLAECVQRQLTDISV